MCCDGGIMFDINEWNGWKYMLNDVFISVIINVFIIIGVKKVINIGVFGSKIIFNIVVIVLVRMYGWCWFKWFYVLLDVELIIGWMINFMIGVMS